MGGEEEEKKEYANITEFLDDPDNEVDEEVKIALLSHDADVQTKVMERGSLKSAKDKTSALQQRIRKATGIEKRRKVVRRGEQGEQWQGEDGDAPRKRVEIDIDLKQPGANAKTEVVSYLQTKIGKCMQKGYFVYKTEKVGESGKWVTTLELPCLDGETMTGDAEDNQKAAEQSAAKAYLESKREEILELNKDARPLVVNKTDNDAKDGEPKAKRPRTGGGGGGAKGGGKGGMNPMMMMPMMMMSMMMKGGGKGTGWGS